MDEKKLYYTIGEVSGILGENVSLVRFWSNTFPKFLKPVRNAKGNRLFTAEDVETLRQLHFLIRDCGLTLEGAAMRLSEDRRQVESRVKAIGILRGIRTQLDEVRRML